MILFNNLLEIRKWVVIIITAIIFVAFQGAYGFLNINGIKPLFMLPLAVCFAMFHHERDACIFGIICGILLDVVSGRLFGFSALMFMMFCVLSSLLILYLIKVNVVNSLILVGVSLIIYYTIDFLFRYVIWGAKGAGSVLIFHILPTILFTLLITPIIYYLCKFYYNKLDGWHRI